MKKLRKLYKGSRVTLKWLEEAGACKEHVDLFKQLYPKGVVLTKDNLIEASGVGLAVSFLAYATVSGTRGSTKYWEYRGKHKVVWPPSPELQAKAVWYALPKRPKK